MILYPISTALTAHTIASHIDTVATGGQLDILVGGDNAARAFLGLGLAHSPEFAGLTLTGYEGIVTMLGGVLTASNILDLGLSA